MPTRSIPTGVIEGFYGRPWSHAARLRCVEHLADWGMSHYLWAAKLEPRHREQWAEPFTAAELAEFAAIAAHRPGVQLGVALTPGAEASASAVVTKLRPAVEAGASALVLSFDDLPVLDAGARHRDLAHATLDALGVPVWLVPTHYAGAERSPYLEALCNGLADDVLLMWTGPTVVADRITDADARARAEACDGRRPMLWDNVPVNDALMTDRLHVGPLEGRDPRLLGELSGVLWNPMPQAEASLLTLASAAAWLRGADPVAAWETEVGRRGVRPFVNGVLGRVPEGRDELRACLVEMAMCEVSELGDDVLPWRDAVRAEAALGLAALDLLDLTDPASPSATSEPDTWQVTLGVMALLAWRQVRAAPVSVFGGRLVARPVADQDAEGSFRVRPGSVSERETVVDQLVRQALRAAGAMAD